MSSSLDVISSDMGVLFQCYFCFVFVEFYLQFCAVRLCLPFSILVKAYIKCALCPALFIRYFGFHGGVKYAKCALYPSPTGTRCELSEQVVVFLGLCSLLLRRCAVRQYPRRALYLFMSAVAPAVAVAVAVAAAVTVAVAVIGRCGCGGGCVCSCGCGCGCGCRCGCGYGYGCDCGYGGGGGTTVEPLHVSCEWSISFAFSKRQSLASLSVPFAFDVGLRRPGLVSVLIFFRICKVFTAFTARFTLHCRVH